MNVFGMKIRLWVGALLVLGEALYPCVSRAASAPNQIDDIEVQGAGDGRTVRIKTRGEPTFTVFRLSDPMRVVVDISGAELGEVHGPKVIEDGVIGQIAVRQFRSEGFVIGRVIIGFEKDCSYDVQTEGTQVVVRSTPSQNQGRATPPIEGPADRAAAERLQSVRIAAEMAAAHAAQERAQAEIAEKAAHHEQEQAIQERARAQDLTQQAAAAQEEATRLRDAAERTVAQSRGEALERARVADVQAQALKAAQQESLERARVADVQAQALQKAQAASLERAQLAEQARQVEVNHKTAALAERDAREAELRERLAEAQRALQAPHDSATLLGVQAMGHGQFLLKLRGRAAFTSERLENPARLVIDLPQARRGVPKLNYSFSQTLCKKVRLGEQEDSLRVVFDLPDNTVTAEVKSVAEGVLVALQRRPSEHPLTDSPSAAALQPPTSDGTVSNVVFSRGPGGGARLVLHVAGDVQAHLDQSSSKAWVLKLQDAHVAAGQERSLDTSAYDTVVRLVSTYQSGSDTVHVVANLTGPATSELRRDAQGWVWDIRGSGAFASANVPQTAGFMAQASSFARSTPTQVRSNQRRISLDVKDADIINVLRLISEETGENIIASDDVKGKVTLKLRNVPADQALDTMLRTKGFDKVRQNNILRIAPAEAIQKERELELAKKRSQTEVEETLIKMVTVNYATAAEIVDQIKPMLTGRGSVQVDARTNTIILQDIASNVDRLVELTRRLDKQTPLVMIQARIVEASTNHLQDLGVQWGGTSQETSRTGNPTGLLFPGDVIASGAADDPTRNQTLGVSTPSRYAVNLPAQLAGAGGGLGFVLGSAGGSQMLNLRLSAMETNGTGKIISSPEVATLDNKTARVSQGVEIPISVTSAAGTNTRFIPAVLELEVTPHVTNDGTVLLKIKTQKSEPDFTSKGAAGDPTIQKKYAETEVLVRDGDTSVIGGIYTRNTADTISEVPFLSKIPILGNLFRNHRKSDQRAELLVFITPRIINREESMVQSTSLDSDAAKQTDNK